MMSHIGTGESECTNPEDGTLREYGETLSIQWCSGVDVRYITTGIYIEMEHELTELMSMRSCALSDRYFVRKASTILSGIQHCGGCDNTFPNCLSNRSRWIEQNALVT